MKRITVYAALAVALALTSMQSYAQNTTATTRTNSTADSSAMNAGNAQQTSVNFGASDVPSHQTLRNVPSIGMPGFSGSFSTDYCGGTAAATVAVAGFGIGGGAPVIDANCVTFRAVERVMQISANEFQVNPTRSNKLRQAAVDMVCQIDGNPSRALQAQGLCTDLTPKATQTASAAPGAASVPRSTNNEQLRQQHGYYGNDPIVMRRYGITQ